MYMYIDYMYMYIDYMYMYIDYMYSIYLHELLSQVYSRRSSHLGREWLGLHWHALPTVQLSSTEISEKNTKFTQTSIHILHI